MTKYCQRNIDDKRIDKSNIKLHTFDNLSHSTNSSLPRSQRMRGRHRTFRLLCRLCVLSTIFHCFLWSSSSFSFFLVFVSLRSVSKSFKLMTARWNVCRTNRMWRVMGTYIQIHSREGKKHLRKLVMFTWNRLSLPLAQRGTISYASLYTPTNEWIIEFVYVQYQVTMKRQGNTKKLTCICFSIFTHLFSTCVCVTFLLFVLFTEKWVMFVLYFSSIECIKQKRKVRHDQNLHARTHTNEEKK